ncbi:MAG: HNH endonuclease [Muribaculaceae bacterium]|nr:HNH endonuclease [Muribaculaceae bacterium]
MPIINRIHKKRRKRTEWKMTDARKERAKIYASKEWQRLRKAYLFNHPLCELCEARGIVTLAEHVHHADSFMNYDTLMAKFRAYDYTNLVALCRECHGWLHRHGATHNCNLEHDAKELDEIYGRGIRIKDARELQEISAGGTDLHGCSTRQSGGDRQAEKR